ncbi:MAG: peptidoglycan D,D-transpeptidase FtsI family protein, partial [Pyrinomonadaceae bacterium]
MAKRIAQKKHNPAQTIFTRFLFIVAVFTVWIGIIGVRLVHLQINQSDWLREKALDQRRDEHKSKMLRGSILDREGRALALSVNVESLYADPSEIDDVTATAKTLASLLKIKPQEIQKTLQDAKDAGKRFVWLARKMDSDAVAKLNDKLKNTELKKADEPYFKGLHWKEEQKRSYPYGSLAAQVVGFSNLDDVGQAGIELSQEQTLKGAVIKTWRDRDRLGRVYDESDDDAEREPPKDIVLTISRSIQYKTEEALRKGVEAANAKSGVAIVIDPKTGEILAMANYPTFDPNKFGESAAENINNRAIQNIYSPGSVFKLVTYGSALQNNLITPDGQFNCGNGVIEVAKHEFRDPHCSKTMTYTDALAISSNIGAIKTGMRVGKDEFYKYERGFGFGDATGIELPAEAKGQLRPPQNWNGDSLASMSIGYEIGVTALQTAVAFATIANDGVRVKPHIIKEIRQSDGKAVSSPDTEKIPVVSQDAARDLRRMLRQVVLKGTGRRAQLDGYSCAGKTGTAWK